jgi:hypothetical protein
MDTSFENVNGATMEMKLGWKIKMNNLDEIHLHEKSIWNVDETIILIFLIEK